jgi:hypothetical protein
VTGSAADLSAVVAVVAVGTILGLATIVLAICPQWRRTLLRPLLSPLALIGIALTISALLVFISYRNHYWIVSRQWIASLALCAIGFVWFAAELSEIAGKISVGLEFILILLLAFLIGQRFLEARERLKEQRTAWQRAVITTGRTIQRVPTTDDEWVALANANIARGARYGPSSVDIMKGEAQSSNSWPAEWGCSALDLNYPESSAASDSGSGVSACAAPSPRSGGCARASPRTAARPPPACGRCSCRCRSACAARAPRAA